jgi:hypothetical protein
MRTFLIFAMLAAPAAGCSKMKPPPAVGLAKVPADNPSILVDPPYPGKDQTGAKPSFAKMSAVGTTKGNNDRIAGSYQSSGNYTLERHDGGDVDPKEVAAELSRWIESAPGVKVTGSADEVAKAGVIRRTIDYGTTGTVGYATFSVEPAMPAKKIQFTFSIQEHRR